MRVNSTKNYSLNFKAHRYKIEPKTSRLFIETDKKESLGSKPSIVYKIGNNPYEEDTMEETNDIYTYTIGISSLQPDEKFSYHIKYMDTSKTDTKNGADYTLYPATLAQRALIETRIQHRQPLIHAIKSGKTIGKVLYKDRFGVCDSLENIKEPTIIITNTFHTELKNPNIVGLIFTNFDSGALSHMSTQFRNYTDVCGSVFDPIYIERLKKLNGENIELELTNEKLNIRKTNKKGKTKSQPTITIPKQEPIDKILSSKEYTSEFVGAKAVNLRRLEELSTQGKINAQIPKSIAIPHTLIQRLFDENIGQKIEYNKNKKYYKAKECAYAVYEAHFEQCMQEIIQQMKENGLNTDANYVMVRSAFNGEDLSNYSAAGLYETDIAEITPQSLYEKIINVAQSKWSDEAIYSRKQQNISDDEIKPTIIIQDRILPEYKFTVYTNFGNSNKLIIEIYSDEMIDATDEIQPHVFEYDRETQTLTYKSIQLGYPTVKFNENQTMTTEKTTRYDLTERPAVFELLKQLIENSIIIEKEFGHPQDIEGGFVGNNIYLWQTRNIVN